MRHCAGWTEHRLFPPSVPQQQRLPAAVPKRKQVKRKQVKRTVPAVTFKVGDFWACRHNSKWFLCQIVKDLDEDGDFELSCMEGPHGSANSFVWPPHVDTIHLPAEAFLLKTPAPRPVGKGAESKVFVLPARVLAEVAEKFSQA